MDFKSFTHITIDSRTCHLRDWIDDLDQNTDWQKDIHTFIEQWLDSSDSVLVETSGSTGKPKTIAIKKNLMLASARATLQFFELEEGQSALLCLPVRYIAGKMMLIRAIVGRLNLIVKEPSSQISLSESIDFAAMVPLQVENCIPELKHVKNLIIGGAPISSSLRNKLKTVQTNVFESYGMTETITHVALKDIKQGDYFKALPGVNFWQDDRGCLIVKAPHLNIEELATNDVIDFEDFTHFKWLGRYDNVINSGGIKLHPEEIEKKISVLLDRSFYVRGEAHETLGQSLILLIEGPTLDDISLELLKSELKIELDKFELPKKIIFVEEFNRTPNGKLKRQDNLG